MQNKLFDRNLIPTLILLVAVSALYRAIPFESRPLWLGAPQLAMAVLAGSVIRQRAWAFALPLVSMLISDLLMQALYDAGWAWAPGFYKGQLLNYILIASVTTVGFFVRHRKVQQVAAGLVGAPVVYFLLSNFAVWASGGGYHRPKTLAGLMQCYADGLPFLGYSLAGTLVFGSLLFMAYRWLIEPRYHPAVAA